MTRALAGLVVISLLSSGAAVAAPTWQVVAHLHSFHESTSDPDITDHTPGLGLMRRTPEHWLLGAGVFRNSLGRASGYAVGGKQWELGPVRAGALAGLTHNYRGNGGGVVPLATGLVTVPLGERLAAEFILIPRVRNYSYATFHIAASWRL
jgi:hypothetical protein